MDDKNLMENILLLEKNVCDLYLHGALEASTASVHQVFQSALGNALRDQDCVYDHMAAKGWYPAEQAEQQKIQTVKQKFAAQSVST